VLFGKLKRGGTVRVTVETKDDGSTGLKLEALADEMPVKPKKEVVEKPVKTRKAKPAKAKAKPKKPATKTAAKAAAVAAAPPVLPAPKKAGSVPRLPRRK